MPTVRDVALVLDIEQQVVDAAQFFGDFDYPAPGAGRLQAARVLVGERDISNQSFFAAAVENGFQPRQALGLYRPVTIEEPAIQIRPDPESVEAELSNRSQVGIDLWCIHRTEHRDERQKPRRPVDNEAISFDRETLRVGVAGNGGQQHESGDKSQEHGSITVAILMPSRAPVTPE